MKLQTAIALLAAASPTAAQYDASIPAPVCAKFRDINVSGVGEFVNTDGSAGPGQTTGDMSISFSLTGQAAPGSYPNQGSFRQISLDLNAVCVNKRDQPITPQDAPVCFYEGELEFCRSFLVLRDEPVIERANKSDVVNPEDFFVFDGRRLVERSDAPDARSDAPDAESDAETGNLRRNLQEVGVFGRNNNNRRTGRSGRNGGGNGGGGNGGDKVDAVRITDEIRADNDPFILNILCPDAQRTCLVAYPFPCIDRRTGGFTAHGTGSSNIEITGGNEGLFGAFGQIITPDSGIDITSVAPNGDITYNFDAGIEICYYRREDSGFF